MLIVKRISTLPFYLIHCCKTEALENKSIFESVRPLI